MELNKKELTHVDKNSLSCYMKELSGIGLLSIEEERGLFKDMHKWVNNEKCSNKVKKTGELARNKLIVSNLRLVIKIAKEYRNSGLDYEDLINEGNLGLMTAVDKFNPEKGAKLSYYSSFWIKQFIRRAISNKGRTIRLPVGVIEIKLKIQKAIEQEHSKTGKNLTNAEISKKIKAPIHRVNKIIKLDLQCESLNTIISSEHDSELQSVVVNNKAQSPVEACFEADDRLVLDGFLRGLTGRERYIIIRRFGLDGAKPDTLEVIGQKFDLTRERIRQLELAALKGLRGMYKDINKHKYIE